MIKKYEVDKLIRYLANESTFEERKEVELWLEQNDSNKKHFEEIRSIWDTRTENIIWDSESAWMELLNKVSVSSDEKVEYTELIYKQPSFTETMHEVLTGFISRKHFIRYASVFIVLIISYLFINYLNLFQGFSSNKITWNEKVTISGQKEIVTLADNSKVTLNSGSRLRYPERFTDSNRDVYLEGEAYFEVAHDSENNFIVHTGSISTSVLGTKFNISAFSDDKKITVSLFEGKIQITDQEYNDYSKSRNIVLSPHQQWSYNLNTKNSEITKFDNDKVIGWKDNKLVFENESLKLVFKKLSRAYGVKFTCSNKSILSQKITTKFENQSIWLVAEVIKKTTGLEYNMKKRNNNIKELFFF